MPQPFRPEARSAANRFGVASEAKLSANRGSNENPLEEGWQPLRLISHRLIGFSSAGQREPGVLRVQSLFSHSACGLSAVSVQVPYTHNITCGHTRPQT